MQAILSEFMETAGTNTGFMIAIAILACLLGAEIAGICILVSKMMRARRERWEQEEADDAEDINSSFREYAVGAAVFLGAIPQSSYIALMVLAGLTALAAVVFLVLLIAFRACGYDFASTRQKSPRTQKEQEAVPAPAPAPVEEDEPFYAPLPDTDEEQLQEAYTAVFAEERTEDDAYVLSEEPDAVFDEELQTEEIAEEEVVEETPAEPASDETSEPMEEVSAEEASEPVAVVESAPAPVAEPVADGVHEGAVYTDGTRPYRVVEKFVKETVKEVYKETPVSAPAQPAQPAQKSGTDAVMEKLADFLEYELQKRKEEDGKSEAAEPARDIPTLATVQQDPEDDEEDDDDELDEAEDKDRDEDDDVDDEENDTDGDRFTGSERILGFDDETGCYIVAHYRKSFEAKLIQSRANIKRYYSEIKNALLSYGGTKSRISWAADSFTNGRTPVAKINVKTRTLELYLALDPASLEDSIYKGTDMSGKKKYADTPFRYKVRSPRKLKWALELVARTCEEQGLSPIDAEIVNYEEQYPFDTTDSLVARKLIKEYIRQEKPASTFELAPDHVPEVPEEDGSVIPANANFSWEFDNEVLEEKAEEAAAEQELAPEPEPISEPEAAPVPEPTPEPAPAPVEEPQPAIYRETVKVTEMHYTEHYYGNGAADYQSVITSEPEIPMLSEAVPAEFEEVPDEEAVAASAEPAEALFEEDAVEVEETAVSEETEAESEPSMEESDEPADPFAAYDELIEMPEEALAEEGEQEPKEEPLPFRPSFYANRNYYAEEDDAPEAYTEAGVDEVDSEQDFEEESAEYVEEAEAYAEETEEYPEETEESAEAFEEAYAEEEYAEEEYAEEYSEETEDYAQEAEEPESYIVESEPVEEPEPETPKVAANPSVAVVDLCSIEAQFPMGAVISLDTLREKELVLPTATVLKVYASGPISKSFTVEANHFTLDAIQAITDADGDSVMVR